MESKRSILLEINIKSDEKEQIMKGNEKVLTTLNSLLADELTAINQYMVHSEMCDNWGYKRLHEAIEKRAIDEMKHAETVIARIIFLEGRPIVNVLREMHIGQDVSGQIESDYHEELKADKAYNDAIKQALDLDDNGTREMMEKILKDEEVHIDWLEAQLDQIKQMGIQNYLSEQTKKE
jgi:bacterioferritin